MGPAAVPGMDLIKIHLLELCASNWQITQIQPRSEALKSAGL